MTEDIGGMRLGGASSEVLIVGAGPAGLFCALELVRRGFRSIRIVDMGKQMSARWCPETQACACRTCYVLEGGGGAGGFSDGKLPYSLLRGTQLESIFSADLEPVLWDIDRKVVEHAGEGVWYDPKNVIPPEGFAERGLEFGAYPLRHVGSDGIRQFSIGMIAELEQAGVEILYSTTVEDIIREDERVIGLRVNTRVAGRWQLFAKHVVIASGIQGIPWLEGVLEKHGISLGGGPAGIGIRVETPAADMAPLFQRFYDWKVVYDSPQGMTLRSFCDNQRGSIVNQWHAELGVRNVNGHSSLAEAARTNSSNFAIVAKVGEDVAEDPQTYVRDVARRINSLSGGHTVVQWCNDFLRGRPSANVGPVWRTNRMSRTHLDISQGMPSRLHAAFCEFIGLLFDAVPSLSPDRAVIYAPEIKYPGRRVPVDLSNWRLQGLQGIHVLGDATGYLDSFVAAAITGVVAGRDIGS